MTSTFKLNHLKPPIFQLDGGETSDPISALSSGRCKPLKKTPSPKANILLIRPKNVENDTSLNRLLTDLVDGVKNVRAKQWKGFHKIFGTKLEIKSQEYSAEGNYVRNVLSILREHFRKYDLSLIYMPEPYRSRIGGPYFQVKAYTILNRIIEQIIIKPTLMKVSNYIAERDFLKYNDLVWNLALSMFTKLGGVPWKAKEPMSPVDIFLAISTVMRPEVLGIKRRAGFAALQIYNNWGEYEKSVYGKLMFVIEDKGMLSLGDKESEEKFIQLISTVTAAIKGRNVVVHLTDLYSEKFHMLLFQALTNEGAEEVKILRIQRTSPLRLYRNIEKPSQAWPSAGAYWYLEPKIAHLYTTGRWRYYPHIPPYAVPSNTVRPLQISLEYPKDKRITKNDLRDILWLTKLYPYMLDAPRTRIPIDLKLSRTYALIIASDENVGTLDNIAYLY